MARIIFVQTEWLEHLGVLYLAASARDAGHQPKILFGRNPKRIIPRVVELDPQVVAFSATTGAHRAALQLAAQLRPWFKGKIIMGGPHPTFFPEVVENQALDAVFRGESEKTLVEFLDRIESGEDWRKTPGISFREDGATVENELPQLVRDLDSIPFPARDLMEEADPSMRSITMARVMAGRGCPYECTYCFNKAMREMLAGKGPYVRLRSVENVIAELAGLKRRGLRTINFVDDTFGLNKKWAADFLEAYAQNIRLPFIVNLRPEQVEPGLVEALGKAGCYCVQLGVESADRDLRKEVLARDVDDETVMDAARMIKGAGILLLTYNMVGLPGESLEQAERTLAWNADAGADFPRVSIFQPYPRTALGEKALAARGEDIKGVDGGLDLVGESYFRGSPLPGRQTRRIENLQKMFHPYIKLKPARPLIRALTALPPNPAFHAVFLLSMGMQYRRATNRIFIETFKLGIKNLGAYFS